MPKLTDVAKQLEAATKELEKDQQDWKVKKGTLQRENIQLIAVNKDLQQKNEAADKRLLNLNMELEANGLRDERLRHKNSELEVENHKLEDSIALAVQELTKVETALAEKKATVDKELDEYSLNRKQAIKAEILAVNDELTEVKKELEARTSELNARKVELSELNEVFKQEQEELKVATAEAETEKKAIVVELEELRKTLETRKEELQKLEFTKDQTIIVTNKAKADHDKFIEYEKKARKILDTKDRALQAKAADMATESQYLKNSRSFLAEL